MSTIKDVAVKAGVSISTVSLVLNNRQNVSDEKYDRVMNAIHELNYRPSIIAQNLKRQRFHLIGVIFPTGEGYYSQILKGIHDVAETSDYDLLVKFSGSSKIKEKDIIQRLVSMGVSGIIIMPGETEDINQYVKTVECGIPIVFIERKIPRVDIPSVTFNNFDLVYRVTADVLGRYKPEEIALITGSSKFSDERECQEGFIEAINEIYPKLAKQDLEITETSFERKRCVFNLIQRYSDPGKDIKCFISSSIRLAEVLREIESLLKNKVEIVSLTGDVWFPDRRNDPSIRRIPREAINMGKSAAELLIEQICEKHPSEVKDIVIDDRYSIELPVVKRTVAKKNRTIRALVLKTNEMDILSKLSQSFVKETGINVEFDFAALEEITSILIGPEKAIEKYDILWCDFPYVDILARQGKIADGKEFLTDDDKEFIDSIPEGIKKCIYGNKINSVFPILMLETVLYYRESAFKDIENQRQFYNKYGIELRLPTTWPEFNMVAEFFDRRSNPDSKFQYGTAMSLISYTLMEEFYMRQWAFKGAMFDKHKKVCLNSTENLRALKSFKDSYSHANPDSLNFFFDEAFHSLLLGEIPMTVGFSAHYLPFRSSDVDEDIEKDIQVTKVPGGRPITGGWVFAINSRSKRKRDAFEYIKWSLQQDMAVIRDLTGSVIPVHETFNNPLLNNTLPALRYMDMNNFNKGLRENLRDKWGKPMDRYLVENKLKEELMKALHDEVTVEEALQNASNAIESILKEERK